MKTNSSFYRELPKVDLHRHLEGSLRVDTLLDIARLHGITLPLAPGLRALVQMQPEDPFNFSTFLSKFQTLRLFYRSPEVITRITREAIEDASRDGLRYLELRFTPVALSRLEGFPTSEVLDWVCTAAQQASADFSLPTSLIVSVNRHEPVETARQVLQLAADYKNRGVVGVDLAGNEVEFPAAPFLPMFRDARAEGLFTTVHAGEWGNAENVREAIEDFEVTRVSHGIRVMEDPTIVSLARERQTVFEVCVTSNYQTGVVSALTNHPLNRMLMAGLNITINTDDPCISDITLSHEYQLAVEELGLPLPVLADRVLAAVDAAFLALEEKVKLKAHIKSELNRLIH